MNIDEKLEESIENKYIKDDKGKNKMELTIEESVYILKRKDFNTYVEDKAIENLLTAYEKEKEKNKKSKEKIKKYINKIQKELDKYKIKNTNTYIQIEGNPEIDGLLIQKATLEELIKEE